LRPVSDWLTESDSAMPIRRTRSAALRAPSGPGGRRAAGQRDALAPFHCPVPPVLPTESVAHLSTAGDCCAAGFQSCLCRLWVIRRLYAVLKPCPLCPRKRTFDWALMRTRPQESDDARRHCLLPPPALRECGHRGLARRRVAVGRRAGAAFA
jgi:hypothetical protein